MKISADYINNLSAGKEINKLVAKHVLELEDYVIENIDSYVDMNFSTNIEDAFDVVEKFSHMKLFKYNFGSEWHCYLGLTGIANTPELAICRAALLVVEERTRESY